MRRLLSASVLAVCMAMVQVAAQAALITTPGLSITNGDKLFNNFTCNVVVVGTGVPTNCDGVDVTAATDPAGNFGLRFQTGAFVIEPGSTVDILIDYDATVTNPSNLIHDVHLAFNGAITGTGFTTVTETVHALPGGAFMGQVSVHNPPPIFDQTIDLLAPQTSVRVSKDVLLGVNQPGPGTASISFVDQFLSQTTVPEPGSVVLFGSMLLGTGLFLRKRAQSPV